MSEIDFVILWVDSSDPKWREEHDKYKGIRHTNYNDDAHFRDWDILRYWFRAVETYAPWVHNIYFVTNGQKPAWLNTEHPKLKHVKHSDFIPEEYLPTFNARTINLNVHRIPGLSEHFVLFDDEMFINGPITPEYYFKKGLPCDAPNERATFSCVYSKKYQYAGDITYMRDIGLVNAYHNRRSAIKNHFWRWHGPYLGLSHMINSWLLLRNYYFSNFDEQHNERPFLKKTFESVWNAEPDLMKKSCSRFREDSNLNIYVMRIWQLASNSFYPRKAPKRILIDIEREKLGTILKLISDESVKSLCLNDCPGITWEDYLYCKPLLVTTFEKKFPDRCSFEISI